MTRTGASQAAPVALALALAAGACACDVGSPASPVFDNGLGGAAADAGIGDGGAYAVCPPALDASYTALLTQMFTASGCGADRPLNCHSASGAAPNGTGNLLDFSDASAIYDELLGADGGGVMSTNLSGNAKVLRVVPGNASASMLYLKLTLKTSADTMYGAGMPQDYPGSVCPEALAAVKAWIDNGAKQN